MQKNNSGRSTIFGVLAMAIAGFLFLSSDAAFAREAESGGNRGSGTDSTQVRGSSSDDDGTPDQGRGDFSANGTLGTTTDDDGTPDQGRGDFNADGTRATTTDDDDGTADQGRGDFNADGTPIVESDDDNGGVGEGERHRSSVAGIVQSLSTLSARADGDHDKGDDIRRIAQEQASSSQELGRAMDAVERRNALLRFFFGTDFKNIGVLESEITKTQNRIDELTAAKNEMTNAALKAEIEAQIAALQKTNDDAENFVQANEKSFSLFGWLVSRF